MREKEFLKSVIYKVTKTAMCISCIWLLDGLVNSLYTSTIQSPSAVQMSKSIKQTQSVDTHV